MPEGHTIHRLAHRHAELLAGEVVKASSPQGRFEAGAAVLSGSKLVSAHAYGKHLFHEYDTGLTLHVHLGLYGKFSDGALIPVDHGRTASRGRRGGTTFQWPAPEAAPPPPVGQIRLRLWNQRFWIDLRGPTACEMLDAPDVQALIDRLGQDPLRDDADGDLIFARIKKREAPLAVLLLDQSLVAGAGLIFVTESLYRAGLRPTTPGRKLSKRKWQQIWGDLVTLMGEAVESGRIDTVRPEHMPEAMGRPPRMDRHGGEVYVYRRPGQPCLVCGSPVKRGELNGRNMYWCSKCQS